MKVREICMASATINIYDDFLLPKTEIESLKSEISNILYSIENRDFQQNINASRY